MFFKHTLTTSLDVHSFIMMPSPFRFISCLEHHNLYSYLSPTTILILSLIHFISCRQKIIFFLISTISTSFKNILVKLPTFENPILNLRALVFLNLLCYVPLLTWHHTRTMRIISGWRPSNRCILSLHPNLRSATLRWVEDAPTRIDFWFMIMGCDLILLNWLSLTYRLPLTLLYPRGTNRVTGLWICIWLLKFFSCGLIFR